MIPIPIQIPGISDSSFVGQRHGEVYRGGMLVLLPFVLNDITDTFSWSKAGLLG